MHTNHRRTNKFQGKKHNRRRPLAYSLRWYKKDETRHRRAAELLLMAHERYDLLPKRYPRTIYYWYS